MTFRLSVISSNATYQLTRSVAAVDEGSQVTVTLTTTGVQNGQALPYTITGTGITLADFNGLVSFTGDFVMMNGSASIVLTARNDLVTEGLETFRITLNDNGSFIGVDVNDTSLTQPTEVWSYQYGLSTTAYGTSNSVGAVWTGSQFVVAGGASAVATSPDGITWTYRAGLAASTFGSVAVQSVGAGGSSIVVGARGKIASSLDGGVTWTQRNITGGGIGDAIAIAHSGIEYLMVCDYGLAVKSPDSITWTRISPIYDDAQWGVQYPKSIIWAGNKFVVGGEIGGVITMASSSAAAVYRAGLKSTTWGAAAVSAMAWNGTIVCAVGPNGKCATSPDGVTWTYRAGLSATGWGSTSAVRIVWSGAQFIVGGPNGKIAKSSDGVTWTYDTSLSATSWGSSASVSALAASGTVVAAAGASGTAATRI